MLNTSSSCPPPIFLTKTISCGSAVRKGRNPESPGTITPISACVRSVVPFTVTLLSQKSCEESKLRGRSGACGVSHAARFLFVSFRHLAGDALWWHIREMWMQIPITEVVKSRSVALNNLQGTSRNWRDYFIDDSLESIVLKWITPLSFSQLDLWRKKEN